MTLFCSDRASTRFILAALSLVCSMALGPAESTEAAPVDHVEGLSVVERVGAGDQTLILIPGMMSDGRVWKEFAERNSGSYDMWIVTLPGFGSETSPERVDDVHATPWINAAAAGVARLIEREQLEDAILVGHGLGGQVALLAGLDHPELIEGVITIDGLPAIVLPRPTPSDQRAAIIEMTIAPDIRATSDEDWKLQVEFLTTQFDEDERDRMASMFTQTLPSVGIEYTIEQYKLDLTPRMADFEPKGLAIVPMKTVEAQGERQVRGLQRTWRKQTRRAQDFEIEYLEGAGHFVMYTNPDDLDMLVETFVIRMQEESAEE